MRQLLFASVVASAIFVAPAGRAALTATAASREITYADPADEVLAAGVPHRAEHRGGLTGVSAGFAADDRGGIDPAQSAIAPIRRNVPTRTGRASMLPEPATWVMLLLGFGAVGAALRRKLRQSEARFDAKIRRIEAGEHS